MTLKKTLYAVVAITGFTFLSYTLAAENPGASKPDRNRLAKTAGSPHWGQLNINNITTWMRSDGDGNQSPAGDNGAYYPIGTGNVVYEDGLVFGGKVFLDASYTTQPTRGIRVGGSTYLSNMGTRAGYVTGLGATAVAADPNLADVRVYRIRRDYYTMTDAIAARDAQLYYELGDVALVTPTQIAAIRQQYDTDWQNWPVTKGAPYVDRNGNGIYDPPPAFSAVFGPDKLISGNYDEPGVAGADPTTPADQVMFTVYNDLDKITANNFVGSDPIGVEIQKTAWAYKLTDALGNVYFTRYRLINKGGVTTTGTTKGSFYVDSMYVCQWSDIDLGDARDDLVGCDNAMNLGFAYNGQAVDSTFLRYGLPPPAVGYDFLGGPKVQGTVTDSAVFNLKTIKGWRNLPMTSFTYFSAGSIYNDPRPWANYDTSTGRWWKMLRGFAPLGSIGTADTVYRFPPGVTPTKFPLAGDPTQPASSSNFIDGQGTAWSVLPGDRRIMLNTGPFRMAPADTQEIYVGVVVGLGADRISSLSVMKANDLAVQTTFDNRFRVTTPTTAPTAPTNLTVTATSSSQVNLSWTASVSGSPTYYRIMRSLTSGSGFVKIDSVSGSVTAYFNTGLGASTTYYYVVYAVNAAGVSPASNQASATTLAAGVAPSAPTSVSATAISSSQINLSWTASATGSPTYYRIMRSLTSGSGFNKIDSVAGSQTTYSNTGLNAGTTYYYIVYAVNSVGVSPASNQASATSSVAAPGIPTPSSPASGATNQATTLMLTWSAGAGTAATSYDLRVSPNPSFLPLAFVDSNITSGTTRTVTGLANNTQYYWKVRARNAGGVSSYSTTFGFTTLATATVTISTPITFPDNPTVSTEYKLISFPMNTNGVVLGPLFPGNTPDDWIMFRDNGAATNFYTRLTSSSTLSSGEGYWLIKRGFYTPSYTGTQMAVGTDGNVVINLHTGWNIIGVPFNASVQWSVVKAANALPTSVLYSYNAAATYAQVTQMDPFKGYYFDNRTANLTQLKIPYPFPASVTPPTIETVYDWKMQLTFESDFNKDAENIVGIATGARNGYDDLDTRKPPLFMDQGFLYFSRPEWDEEFSRFNGDIRADMGEGQVWEFEVFNPRKSMGTVRLIGVNTVPVDYEVKLINLDNTTPIDVRTQDAYTFQSVKEKTKFRLIVGKRAYVEDEVKKYIPSQFALYQNYPNPFNPSTTLSFALPKDATVRLEVVNILGQLVAAIAQGKYAAGLHSMVWDASDGRQGIIPSGVYFSRLIVDGTLVQSRKMILTK